MESNSERGNEVRVGEVSSGVVLRGRLIWVILGPLLMFLTTYQLVAKVSCTAGSFD